jgi:hypothetical protein
MYCPNCGTSFTTTAETPPFDIEHEYAPTEPTGQTIDPDTGTTESWKSYLNGWRKLDQRILKALRTRLTRKGMPPFSWNQVQAWAEDIVDWAEVYMNAQYPGSNRSGCLPCGTPQGRGTYQFTGLNLHELWEAEKPLWYEDEWDDTVEIHALFAEYDNRYADAVEQGIIEAS